MHPLEAEQLTNLLTEIENQRRIIAVLACLVVELKGQDAVLEIGPEIMAHLGHCVTGQARLTMDRAGRATLTIEKGHL